MIRYLGLLLLFFVPDSAIKSRLLQDGITKVPADENYFTGEYRDKYEIALPENVTPGALYVETYYVGFNFEWFEVAGPYKQAPGCLVFYENGCVNSFSYQQFGMNLNPEYNGYRGICYKKKGKLLSDMLSPEAPFYSLSACTAQITVSPDGDTLYLKEKKPKHSYYIYLKDKSGIKTNYTANW